MKKEEKIKYFISKEGLITAFYQIIDEEYAKNVYNINSDEIIELTNEELMNMILKEKCQFKSCMLGTTANLDSIVIAERRVNSNIRKLKIDEDIENFLQQLSKLTDEEREEIAERTQSADNEACSIFEKMNEYVKITNKTTITISNVSLFTLAVGNSAESLNLIRNLKRNGIDIFFKDDGVWTGNSLNYFDIGALVVLSRCI